MHPNTRLMTLLAMILTEFTPYSDPASQPYDESPSHLALPPHYESPSYYAPQSSHASSPQSYYAPPPTSPLLTSYSLSHTSQPPLASSHHDRKRLPSPSPSHVIGEAHASTRVPSDTSLYESGQTSDGRVHHLNSRSFLRLSDDVDVN